MNDIDKRRQTAIERIQYGYAGGSIDESTADALRNVKQTTDEASNREFGVVRSFLHGVRERAGQRAVENTTNKVRSQTTLTYATTDLVKAQGSLHDACIEFETKAILGAAKLANCLAIAGDEMVIARLGAATRFLEAQNAQLNAAHELEATHVFKDQNLALGQRRKEARIAEAEAAIQNIKAVTAAAATPALPAPVPGAINMLDPAIQQQLREQLKEKIITGTATPAETAMLQAMDKK